MIEKTVKTMYHLAPFIKLPETIDLPATSGPNSMYQVKPLVQVGGFSSLQAAAIGVCNGVDSSSNDVVQQLSARQEVVMQRLRGLQQQLEKLKGVHMQEKKNMSALHSSPVTNVPQLKAGVCHDLVISASPLSPPYSVLALAAALRTVGYTVLTTAAVHSSVDPKTVPLALSSEFCSSSAGSTSRADHQVVLSFVWSAVPRVMLMVNPLSQCTISGEGNVLRYLSRLLPASSPYHYEGDASFSAIARTDLVLDDCTTVLAASFEDKKAIGQFVKKTDEALKKSSAATNEPVFGAVGDVAIWSALRQLQERGTKLPSSSLKWISTVGNSIVAGLLLRTRVSDPPSDHQEYRTTSVSNMVSSAADQGNIASCDSGDHSFSEGFWSTSRPTDVENCSAQGNVTSCNSGDNSFSEGFWSTSLPTVPENYSAVPDHEGNLTKEASSSDSKVIGNIVPHERNLNESHPHNPKSKLLVNEKKFEPVAPKLASVQIATSCPDDARNQDLNAASPPLTDTGRIDGHVQYEGLVARMDQLDINYQLRHHDSVMTVSQLLENVGDMPGWHMKNLFLRDKKKKTLYLVCARHNAKVQLNKVGKQLGCRELRFTDRDVLHSVLGVEPGHVTAYALINDVRNVVTLVLDEAVTYDKQQMVNFHPMVNTATLGMSAHDLLSFIEFTGHKPLFMKFDDG